MLRSFTAIESGEATAGLAGGALTTAIIQVEPEIDWILQLNLIQMNDNYKKHLTIGHLNHEIGKSWLGIAIVRWKLQITSICTSTYGATARLTEDATARLTEDALAIRL